jgi:uncharacterized membrane protein
MTYELFLTAFDHAETASEANSWLHTFVHTGDLQVLDVVMLAKRDDDAALIRQVGDLGSHHSGRIGAVVGGLLGAAGGPVGIAALGAAGAAIGAAGEFFASRDLYHDDLRELEQALTPGTSALLALLAPEHAASYALHIADFGGETLRYSLTNDAGHEFQQAKQAFIARQAERRREQLAAWSSTTAAESTDLDTLNHELEQIYAAISSAPAPRQVDLLRQAAALRTRRDAARGLLNQTLAADVQRLDDMLVRYTQALSGATSNDERAALAAQQAALRNERRTAQQQQASCQKAELQERWRDISAIEVLATRADLATRIELDLLLTQLRDQYAVARQAHVSASAA